METIKQPPEPPKRPCVHQEDELFVTGRFPEWSGQAAARWLREIPSEIGNKETDEKTRMSRLGTKTEPIESLEIEQKNPARRERDFFLLDTLICIEE